MNDLGYPKSGTRDLRFLVRMRPETWNSYHMQNPGLETYESAVGTQYPRPRTLIVRWIQHPKIGTLNENQEPGLKTVGSETKDPYQDL